MSAQRTVDGGAGGARRNDLAAERRCEAAVREAHTLGPMKGS